MRIKDIMMQNHTSNVYEAARQINAAETDRICDVFQQSWNNGEAFTGVEGFFGTMQRETDTEDEVNACAQQLQNALENLIRREWLTGLSREEAENIATALLRARITDPARLHICQGISFDASDIVNGWNRYHDDAEPLIMPAPEYI